MDRKATTAHEGDPPPPGHIITHLLSTALAVRSRSGAARFGARLDLQNIGSRSRRSQARGQRGSGTVDGGIMGTPSALARGCDPEHITVVPGAFSD
jgi:hypothetical protein